jgi:hypothetical protein
MIDAVAAKATVTPQTAARLRFAQARSAMRAYARTRVASACRACSEPINARRSTRRFCSSPCRQRAYRAGRRPILAPVAHQRHVREAEAARDPRRPMATLEGCTVVEVAELRSHREWIAEWTPDKGRYVWFEGSRREKRALQQTLKYPPKPYPKRRRAGGHQ